MQKNCSKKPYEKDYNHKNGIQNSVLITVPCLEDFNICFVIEISEQKELEQRKVDFISIALHKLKPPITSLKIFMQLLQRQLSTNTRRYLRKMDDRLHVLLSDLLDVTKIRAE